MTRLLLYVPAANDNCHADIIPHLQKENYSERERESFKTEELSCWLHSGHTLTFVVQLHQFAGLRGGTKAIICVASMRFCEKKKEENENTDTLKTLLKKREDACVSPSSSM